MTVGELQYYRDPDSTRRLGVIPLAGSAILACSRRCGQRGVTCLTVRHEMPHRSYFLRTSSSQDYLHWQACLKSALPYKIRRVTNDGTRDYQALVFGRKGSCRAEELQCALNDMLTIAKSDDDNQETHHLSTGPAIFPASDAIVQAHSDLYTMDRCTRDSKVKDALATVLAATCPTVWREVELHWDDTAFPLGLDFETLQGGQIVVKNTFGLCSYADIQAGDVIVALNSQSVQGQSLEDFFSMIRKAAPGSNPIVRKAEKIPVRHRKAHSTGSSLPLNFLSRPSLRRLKSTPSSLPVRGSPHSTTISFTIARKLAKDGTQSPLIVKKNPESSHRKHSAPATPILDWV